MANLNTVRARVSRHAPNLPNPVVDQALSDAARIFFRRSESWRVNVPITFAQNVYSVVVPSGSGTPLNGLTWYRASTASLPGGKDPKPGDFEGPESVDWDQHSPGRPRYYGSVDAENMLVWPKPDKQYTITFSMVVSQALDGLEIPNALFQLYLEVIVHGAAVKLLENPQYTQVNKDTVPYHLKMFEDGITQAFADTKRNRTRAHDSVSMAPLA